MVTIKLTEDQANLLQPLVDRAMSEAAKGNTDNDKRGHIHGQIWIEDGAASMAHCGFIPIKESLEMIAIANREYRANKFRQA